MKILYLTTVGATMGFFECFIRELLEEGHTIDIACNDKISPVPECYKKWGCRIYSLPCSRAPFAVGNIKTVQKIKKLVEKKKYDIVHCHTPIVSVCTRIACRRIRKNGTKVFYTAHGFHFYSGAPLWNWLFYFPVEWLCSWWTDVLITINKEDYRRAQKRLHAKKTVYVPGVGIDTKKFGEHCEGKKLRDEFEIEGFMLLSVGELNENKNHESVIKAVAGMNLTYVIVGSGILEERLRTVAEEVGTNVIFTGFRKDVAGFYDAADAYILPSIREGLNVSLMEAMASRLPCLVGDIRGNTDLIDEFGGYLFTPTNIKEIREAVEKVLKDRGEMGIYNFKKIRRSFDIDKIEKNMLDIYGEWGDLSHKCD